MLRLLAAQLFGKRIGLSSSARARTAINGLPEIYVFTHDSIAMGEDGPTHQPVEQLVGLRSILGRASSRRRQ